MKRYPVVTLACLLILSLVFLISGFAKLTDPYAFVRDIVNYRLFPPQPLHILAVWLIMLELFVGFGLWIPFLQRGSAWIAAGLMSFFIVLVAVTMIRGLDIRCGCYGPGSQTVGWVKLMENMVLLLAALYLVWPKKNDEMIPVSKKKNRP
jgi:putative oxidoreductase